MSGILDLFDSPDLLSSILGAGGVTPSNGYMNTAAPASPAAAPAPQGATPNPPADWSTYSGMNGGLDPNGQMPPGAMAPAPSAMPSIATPASAAPAPNPVSMGPAPQDAFGSMANGSTGNAAQLVMPPGAGAPGPMPPRPVGPPMSIVPPPASTGALPPNAGGPGGYGLAQILGATRPQPWQNALTAGMAGLGKGLSAVGAQRPGATGAASFAAGAGGALQGGSAALQQQEQQQRQARMDLFNTSSTAFRDMLAAQNQDDVEGYRKAQGNYLTARAASMKLGGGPNGSGAWQNTPYGKTIQVENEAQKYEKGQQILLQKRWTLNGTSPEQQQTDLDNLGKNVDAYRNRLYKSAGIDPSQGEKMKDWGTTSDNPFQTKGMTLQQFNDQVPMGAWYTDQNGVARQAGSR